MNKIIISILIIFFVGIYFFKDKILFQLIHFPIIPIANIDTSFLTNDKKQEFINIWNILLQNNIDWIDISNNIIQYYDVNHNTINIDATLWENIEKEIEKYKLKSFSLHKDDTWNLIRISIVFLDKKFIYTYFLNEQTYMEWNVVFSSYRIEKVIDKNWYILRLCENRNICLNLW